MIGMVYTSKKNSDNRAVNPVALLLVASVLILMLGVAFNIVTTARQSDVDFVEVIVESGDTVWGSVRDVYGDSVDIRDAVALTIEVNGLKDGLIHPGTSIKIPIPVNVDSAEALKTM